MKLDETLQLVALQVPLDPDALIKFAAEDSIGGWDLNNGGWPIGSLWSVEGKFLYALIRLVQPELVVEIGTHRGCSTTHFATALDINGKGEIVSLDLAEGVGDLIPAKLREVVSLVAANGADWLAEQPDESIDIIYEDADHSTETSRDVALLAQKKLKPGGFLIVHDAAHDYAWVGDGAQITSPVGETIRRGLTAALGDQYRVYRTDPSDCGFALWQKAYSDIKTLPKEMQAQASAQLDIHSTPTTQPAISNPALAEAIAQLKEQEPAEAQPTDVAVMPQKAFSEMNRDELVKFAEDNKIDLTGARTNVDRVAKILASPNAKIEDA